MTVRVATSGEKAKLRGGRQYSQVFVIPRVPNVIYSARLAAVPTSTDMVYQISVTDGVGDIADVRPDMKILVGNGAGLDDIGFCRVRGNPDVDIYGDGTIDVGELSHIDWLSDCHITVVDDYDIFPRPIRIVNGVSYVDYNIPYTDQHTSFDPIVNMGGLRVLLLDPEIGAVSHVRNCTDEDSQVFDGTVAGYLWEAPGASSLSGETTDEVTIEYNSDGHFVEYCTLTSDDGKTFTGVRYTFVVNIATLESLIHSLRISETRKDGVSFSFEMTNDAKLTDFKHRAFVIGFAIDYYNGVPETISYRDYEGNILACGRIAEEELEFNDEMGRIKFTARDWKYWLKRVSAFPFGVERATNTPAAWTSIPGLNVDRATWELLHYYCTISRIADIHLSDDDRYAEELASTSNNLAAQLEEITFTSIFAELVFDCFGVGWLRIEPQLVPEADRTTWPIVQEILSDDYVGSLSIQLNTYEEMSQMNSSGVSVEEFGSAAARISLSYGHIYAPLGDPSTATNLLLKSQEQSNVLSGLFMGWNNRKFDAVSIEWVGNNRMFSIAEYCRAEMEIIDSQNPRGVSYNGYMIPQGMTKTWDPDSGLITINIDFQDESQEQIAITGDFPADTGIDEDFSNFPMPSIPPLSMAILPTLILPPAENNPNPPKKLVIATSKGVIYTINADADDPNDVHWEYMNEGLSDTERAEITELVVTPSGRIYILTDGSGGDVGWNKIMVANGLGGGWSEVLTGTQLDSYYSGLGFTGWKIWGIGVNPLASDTIAAWCGRKWTFPYDGCIGYSKIAVITGGSVAHGQGNDWYRHGRAGIVFNNGGWTVIENQGIGLLGSLIATYSSRLPASGGSIISAVQIDGAANSGSNCYACPVGTQDTFYYWKGDGLLTTIMRVTNSGTVATPQSINPPEAHAVAFSPTGTHAMAASGVTPYKTVNSGDLWSSAGGTVPAGSDVWENCRDDNRWVFGGGFTIKYSLDQGATHVNILGNLLYIAALADISIIRFIE